MPFKIIQGDITKIDADAIVNAANSSLLGGGGVDGAIHRAAGPELLAECRTLGGCQTGKAKITKGYNLPAKHVIHTVGPVWNGGKNDEKKLLADCYMNSLTLAKVHKLESIAFPLISSGAFGYPKDQALQVAVSVIGDFLLNNDMTVYLVVFDKASFVLSEKLFSSITKYIDKTYIQDYPVFISHRTAQTCPQSICDTVVHSTGPAIQHQRKLDDVVKQLDETFSRMLLRIIDEKGMTDAQAYRAANVDRRLFSKIRSDLYYKPSKPTVIAFAIALRLNLDETKDLLFKAGFALSNSSKFDVIVRFFIENGNYNIFEINEALFFFEQNILGNFPG